MWFIELHFAAKILAKLLFYIGLMILYCRKLKKKIKAKTKLGNKYSILKNIFYMQTKRFFVFNEEFRKTLQ